MNPCLLSVKRKTEAISTRQLQLNQIYSLLNILEFAVESFLLFSLYTFIFFSHKGPFIGSNDHFVIDLSHTVHMISLLQLIAKLSSGMFLNAVVAFHLNLWVIY